MSDGEVTSLATFLPGGENGDRWGGPGHIRDLRDDDSPPGLGEKKSEERIDEVIKRRVLLIEESILKTIKWGGAK